MMQLLQRVIGRDDEPDMRPVLDEPMYIGEAFRLLANDRRRWLIDHIADRDDSIKLGELAEFIAYMESDHAEDPSQVLTDERKRVYIALYQNHLPALKREGIVEWDERGGTVWPTDRCRHLAWIHLAGARANGGVA